MTFPPLGDPATSSAGTRSPNASRIFPEAEPAAEDGLRYLGGADRPRYVAPSVNPASTVPRHIDGSHAKPEYFTPSSKKPNPLAAGSRAQLDCRRGAALPP